MAGLHFISLKVIFLAIALQYILVVNASSDTILSNFVKHEQIHCPHNAYSYGGTQMTVEECALICQATDDCTFLQYDPSNTEGPCWMRYGCEPNEFHQTATTYEKTKSVIHLSNVPKGMVKWENKDCYGGDSDYFLNTDENVCVFLCLMTNCMTLTWLTHHSPQIHVKMQF